MPGEYPISNGVAALAMDLDSDGGWLLTIDGVPSSYVDVNDPTYLDFEYVRWVGHLVDQMREPSTPIRAVHLGGAGCTIPRYVDASRPGSAQVIFDYDPLLLDLVREAFGLRSRARFRLRVADARDGLVSLPPASQDLVVRDAFAGPVVPDHLQTVEFLRLVARTLRTGGIYVANLADRPPLTLAKTEIATALAAFRHVVAISEPQVFRGRREGNVVIVASDRRLPEAELVRTLSTEVVRARLMTREDLAQFSGGAPVQTDRDLGWDEPGTGDAADPTEVSDLSEGTDERPDHHLEPAGDSASAGTGSTGGSRPPGSGQEPG